MKKIVSIISIILILIISTVVFAANVSVTGIKVEKTNITIEMGQTEKIVATISPNNATNKTVNWSSSNNNIATVNSNGEIKGISGGVATIKGTTVDGGYTVNITVSVAGQSSINTEKYSIVKRPNSLNEEIKYITKIEKKTNVNAFKNNISTYVSMEFYNLANERLADLDYVFSGAKLKLSDNSEYTLIVTGDVNSDGNVSVVDLSRLKIRMVGLSTLDDYQTVAADVNLDDKLTLTDLSNLKLYLVGLKESF